MVGDDLFDGVGPTACRVAALEDVGADENVVADKMRHDGGGGRGGDLAGGKLDDGEAADLLGLHDEVVQAALRSSRLLAPRHRC